MYLSILLKKTHPKSYHNTIKSHILTTSLNVHSDIDKEYWNIRIFSFWKQLLWRWHGEKMANQIPRGRKKRKHYRVPLDVIITFRKNITWIRSHFVINSKPCINDDEALTNDKPILVTEIKCNTLRLVRDRYFVCILIGQIWNYKIHTLDCLNAFYIGAKLPPIHTELYYSYDSMIWRTIILCKSHPRRLFIPIYIHSKDHKEISESLM